MTPVAIIGEEARDTALEAREAAVAARGRRAARGGHTRAHQLAARRAAVKVASAALEARDHDTSAHSDDVVVLCRAIADRLGIRGQERADLIAAAKLHDVGKVAVPVEIIVKPDPLDELEWQTMRQHTLVGEQILSSVHELKGVAAIVRSCHERYDGGGYPDGLAGEEIPLAARVVFCADAFHAMREDRPYRKGRSAAKALAEVRRNAGGQFDPRVVRALDDAARELRQAGPDRLASLSAPLRSRRLMALLLTMMVGGSTLSAAGLRLPTPFGGSDEPDAPAAAGPGCGRDCSLDLGSLGRLPVRGAPTGLGGVGGAGASFAPGGVGFRSDGRPPATRRAGDPPQPAGGAPSAPGGNSPSGRRTGENGTTGGSGAAGGQGSAPAQSDPGGAGGAPGGGTGGDAPGDQGGQGGTESNSSDPGVLQQVLSGAPELPLDVPELPLDVPELPVRLPEVSVEVPKLPKLPKLLP